MYKNKRTHFLNSLKLPSLRNTSRYCESLQDISALERWNVSNGTDFSSMFRYCTSLQNISLPNSLRYLDENMFKDCNPNLKIRWKQYLYTYADLLEYKKIY